MKQDDGYDNDFTDKANTSSEGKIEDMADWRNEHGQPNFEYLQSLADDGSSGALEKLRSIADDLDVNYDPGASIEELVESIRLAIRSDPNITT